MRWILTIMLAAAAVAAQAEDKPAAPASVDPAAYKVAMDRLAAKAATQPSELDRLRAENAQLRRELTALKKEIAALEADRPPRRDGPDRDPKLSIGMTFEEVNKILGKGKLDFEDADHKTFIYSERQIGSVRSVTVTFRDGRVAALDYFRRDPREYAPVQSPGLPLLGPRPSNSPDNKPPAKNSY